MKRLGLFQLYDEDGFVNRYIYYLLDSLRGFLDDLIIVSNGPLDATGYQNLSSYTDRIFLREDIGFDGGAFQDVIVNFCKDEDWSKWDQVILMNDTFYGPIVPWNIVFKYMEEKRVDYWGLDENSRTFDDGKTKPYIVPYFIVFNKGILVDDCFVEFWRTMKCEGVYGQAAGLYTLTPFFEEKGYRYTTWIREKGGENIIPSNKAHYLCYAYEMLHKYQFPVVKYKLFSIFMYKEAKQVLDYLREKTDYDVSLIKDHVHRLMEKNQMCTYSTEELEEFVNKYKNIYIIGHGLYADGLTAYFNEHDWKIKSYIVTNRSPNSDCEIAFDEMEPCIEDGYIVALGYKNIMEVARYLQKIPKEQLLLYKHRSLEEVSS